MFDTDIDLVIIRVDQASGRGRLATQVFNGSIGRIAVICRIESVVEGFLAMILAVVLILLWRSRKLDHRSSHYLRL